MASDAYLQVVRRVVAALPWTKYSGDRVTESSAKVLAVPGLSSLSTEVVSHLEEPASEPAFGEQDSLAGSEWEHGSRHRASSADFRTFASDTLPAKPRRPGSAARCWSDMEGGWSPSGS